MLQTKSKPDDLILSVDDIGVCRENDDAFAAKINPALLDRVSVMTGFGGLEHLTKWLARVPALDLHLNLTELESRPGSRHAPSRIQIAKRRARFALRAAFGYYSPSQAQEIWQVQIEAFRMRFGRYPDGLNSHEHIHLFPPYFRRVVSLAKKYQIGYIRLGMKPGLASGDYRSWIFARFHGANLNALAAAPCTTSQAVYSYDTRALTPEQLSVALPGKTEVIFHPSLSEDIEALAYLVQKR